MNCVDLMLTNRSQNVINEVFFLFRKKFGHRSPKVVYHTLVLIEAIVKNCGASIHAAVNNDAFMREMGKLAKKYVGKVGVESKEVADQCLDMIQAWGEGFAPYERNFPNIVKLFRDLRKERLPFKSQHDPSRGPAFAPSNGVQTIPGSSGGDAASNTSPRVAPPSIASTRSNPREDEINTNEDAFLAAALAASLADMGISDDVTNLQASGGSRSVESESVTLTGMVESLKMSITLLCEMIPTASSTVELSKNDIISDLVMQLRDMQAGLGIVIEQELSRNSDVRILFYHI